MKAADTLCSKGQACAQVLINQIFCLGKFGSTYPQARELHIRRVKLAAIFDKGCITLGLHPRQNLTH